MQWMYIYFKARHLHVFIFEIEHLAYLKLNKWPIFSISDIIDNAFQMF